MKVIFKTTLISILVGLLAGVASALFLISLEWVTNTRTLNPKLIFGLPFAGILIGYIYQRYSRADAGINQVIDEIHSPKNLFSINFSLLIFFSTLASHLFGASVGREGTAVQMGAALSDQLAKIFTITPEQRRRFLIAGAGAGFGSAIGVPLAGVVFGMEFYNRKKFRVSAWYESIIASMSAYAVTYLLQVKHLSFPNPVVDSYSIKVFIYTAIAGIIFGIIVLAFCKLTYFFEKLINLLVKSQVLKPFIGGILILALYYAEGSFRFMGLGISEIQTAFLGPSHFELPLFKIFFTTLAISVGFKGGEFTPLVFIGATLGSALSLYLPLETQYLAALGFIAVFAGASKTPLACSLMAIEIFGFEIAPFAIIVAFLSAKISGRSGIYKSQIT